MDTPTIELLQKAQNPLVQHEKAKRLQECLDQGADLTAVNTNGATPLLLVAKQGSAAALELLLEAGADTGARDKKGYGVLHYASESLGVRKDIAAALLPERKAIIERLLALGLDPNATAENGRSPLWNAAGKLPGELCALLLDAGASLDLRTKDKRAPLDIAVQQANQSAAKLLIERGAEVTEKQLKFAEDNHHAELAVLLREHLGISQPGVDAPLDHLTALAAELGAEAYESAEATGDLQYHEDEEDLDPDDLVDDYWDGQYKQKLLEAAETLPSPAKKQLPQMSELLPKLYAIYARAFRDEM